MTVNASHVVVHHHFDNASGAKLISMTCCIVLSVVIVLILLIILAIIIYMLLQRTKRIPQDANPANVNDPLPTTRASNTFKVESSNIRRGIVNPAASFEDNETDINSNRQSIPMTTFRVDNEQADSSESSTGLCEVLFPQQHDGEVVREPPPKVVAFAGRVYATTRRNSRPPEPQPSGSGTLHQSVNTTMEWDYHESRRYGTSNDSEEDRRNTINICWV